MAVEIFNWVVSPSFISLDYTQLSNPFIKVGWELTRNLTNIFFVLGLVIIGLGTALRRTGYQAQKTLPTLIIIALLINFTPVLLGLIVDASNIAMDFFVQGGFGGGNNFANYATSQWGNIESLVGGARFWDPTANQEATAAAVGSFVLIFFNLIAGLIYLLFALIFILRYIAIWTLVILSPFAFACYIFPTTRKVFSQWWQQFIQWSIIGVIAAFFLYLSDHFIRKTTQEPFLATSMGEITNASGLAPLINSIMPYFVAIIFLFIGLMLSLTFAPQGASAIIKGGQKGINKTLKATGRLSAGATRGIPAVTRAEEKSRKWLETKPLIGRMIGGATAFERGKVKKMSELAKPYEGLPPEEIEKVLKQKPITRDDRLKQAGIIEHLAKRGSLRDSAKTEIIKAAQAVGMAPTELLKRRPDWAPDLGKSIVDTINKMEPEDLRKNIQQEALKNVGVVSSLLHDKTKMDEMVKGKLGNRKEIVDTIKANWQTNFRNLAANDPEVKNRLKEILGDPRWPK